MCSLPSQWAIVPRNQPVVNSITGQQPLTVWAGGRMMGCWKIAVMVVCQLRKGQGKLMGSICCTWIPFILVAISQSHLSPLLDLYSANPLVDLKTHTSTDTVVLFLCHDSHDLLCLWIHVLCLDSFFVMITSYCTFLSQSWQFCSLSAPLGFRCLHTPYCYLFLANWSMRCPALNY